jgi:hypothetical protein
VARYRTSGTEAGIVTHRLLKVSLLAGVVLVGCSLSSAGPGSQQLALASWATPAWYIDPANATGSASDGNGCTTQAAPCTTYAEIVRRWGTTAPAFAQTVTVTFLSSQADNTDPVTASPSLSSGSNLLIEGVLGPAQQVTSGVLSAVAVKNRTTGHLLQATLPAGAAAGQLVINATHASRAWVYANAGGATWYLSQPLAPAASFPPPAVETPAEVDTWANGDAVSLYAPVNVDVAQASAAVDPNGSNTAGVVELYQLTVFDPAGPNRYDPFAFTSRVRVVESAVQRVSEGTALSGATVAPSFLNDNVEADVASDLGPAPGASLSVTGGQINSPAFGAYVSMRGADLDGDIILGASTRADLIGGTYGEAFLDHGVVVSVLDGALSCTPDSGAYGSPVLWGPGTVDVAGTASMAYPAAAGRAQSTFIGGLALQLDSATTACSGTPATNGNWHCGIALTAANLDLAAASGGFGGTAVQPGGATITNGPPPDAGAPEGGTPDAGPDATLPDATPPLCVPPPVPTAPAGPPVCGDGWRDLSTEECDDGLGASSIPGRGCSSTCQVIDKLAVAPALDASVPNVTRTLGAGRHPLAASDTTFAVAYLEPDAQPPGMAMATFSSKGVSTGVVRFAVSSTVVPQSDPVLAGLPCDRYAAAWTDRGGDGDGLGVAIRLVDPTVAPSGLPSFANVTTAYSQSDPDVLWTGSEVVVAWADTSSASTGPDLRYRTFDAFLNPTSTEQTLAATADVEGDVTLAAFEGSWAAAWRDDANGFEQIRVHTGSLDWTVGPAFLPAPDAGKLALVELDASHLLLIYPVGTGSADGGVPNATSSLQVAILDTAKPGSVTGGVVPIQAAVEGSASALSHGYPALVRVGANVFASWWTAGAPGNPEGEDVWLQPVGWNGVAVDWTGTELPLPRQSAHLAGDQRNAELGASALAPEGALIGAWDDLGETFGAREGQGDTALALRPLPLIASIAP